MDKSFFDEVIDKNKALMDLHAPCGIVCSLFITADAQMVHQWHLQICLVNAASLITIFMASGV